MVVNELRGEKIDIVPFSEDLPDFVAKALQPAKVKEVRIHEDTGTAEVIVPDYQLSLAIGKEGQNARLAARLTGWRVDIKSETQLAEEESYQNADEWAQGEWVVDRETGEQVWVPADEGDALSTDVPSGADGDAPASPSADDATTTDEVPAADAVDAAPVEVVASDDEAAEAVEAEAEPTIEGADAPADDHGADQPEA
jgi:transcription termination/antitermination protein NusA